MISHDFNIYHNSLGLLTISCWKNKEKQGSARGSAQLYVDDDEGSAQFFGT